MLRWTLNVALFAVGCLLAAYIATEVARDRAEASRQVILDRNQFDSSRLEPAPPPEQIEKSRLPVTLIGTFAANEPSLSRATLHDRESKETLVVGIGDQVEDQALVVRIEQGRVVLRENGATRELALDGAEHGTSQSTDSRSGASPSESEHAMLTHLLSQSQVVPKFEDGSQMVGLEVSVIQAGSLFEEIGLENGDVITEFNGVPVDSQAKIAKVLQEMFDAGEVHMVGRRADGSEQVWDFVR